MKILDPSKYAPIPERLRAAVQAGDVTTVIQIWMELITAMPSGDPTNHPLLYAAVFADDALNELGRERLTPEQLTAPRFERKGIEITYFNKEVAGVA